MEILNDQRSRRTVLMVTDGIAELSALRDILENEYNTILMDNSSRDFALIKEQSGELSAAVIAAKEAAAENYGLFDWISRDSMIAAIPMLIYCETEEDTVKKFIELADRRMYDEKREYKKHRSK